MPPARLRADGQPRPSPGDADRHRRRREADAETWPAYVGQFNARHRRTGTLWEGRYKACLVDSESYVLRCMRYIDLNPVRARLTDNPVAYRWSSCAALCGGRDDPLLTPHPAHRALGTTAQQRASAYRAVLDEALSDADLQAIRLYLQQQRAWGRNDFQAMVQAKTRRFAATRPAHRPPAARKPARNEPDPVSFTRLALESQLLFEGIRFSIHFNNSLAHSICALADL